jgi:predicted flap endonuclease-1-like 5' DNA nuclease
LPSDINPTYDRLDIDNPGPAVDAIVNQLRAWRVLASAPNAAPAAAEDPATVDDLIQGLGLGDYDNATLRAYALMRVESRESQKTVVARLVRFLRGSQPDNKDTLIAGSVLESISQLDPSLVPIEAIEELAGSADYSTRSIAATLLWDRAKVAPADVPLGLLGRLALPAREDWYVQAPAMAAAKQLLLHRRAARIVFDVLAASDDSDDRHAVASALLDVARVDPTAVPSDLADRLARDEERLVMMKATEVLAVLRDADDEQKDSRSPFGL